MASKSDCSVILTWAGENWSLGREDHAHAASSTTPQHGRGQGPVLPSLCQDESAGAAECRLLDSQRWTTSTTSPSWDFTTLAVHRGSDLQPVDCNRPKSCSAFANVHVEAVRAQWQYFVRAWIILYKHAFVKDQIS
ncbi:hypothetical protein SELMODRAFT_416432 [Selaginella moellendorffii]|uniref:Uncharacterized protein n=1 Tax=Selaginella moellendorffii TaxID=88036 RepID=D8RZ95_SELML|nr:hypothetical protein SELMODRAFT_416432 [Selaginella moellendorffii]